MEVSVREPLAGITTVPDMVQGFQDEDHCRRLLEAMVWPTGRICLACGYRRSIALIGRESGKQARPKCQMTSWNENIGVTATLDINNETNGSFSFSL
jgi:hypothetical protein